MGSVASRTLKLAKEAERRGIRIPLPRTLSKYGMTASDWLAIMHRQDWKCPICTMSNTINVWNIDHQHVPGWNKMIASERKRYVRGVLCWRCNKKSAPSNLSAADARRLAAYLEIYENLRDLREG